MILFRLKCSKEHEFEGWFRDNAAYDRQHAKGVIECPACGDTAVEKAPMAPRLGRSRGSQAERIERAEQAKAEAAPADTPPAPQQQSDRPPTPAEMRVMLREMRKQVESNCDYVGPKFAEEARRIHRGEGRARGIYGEATPAESEKLADEGIEIASIPWVPLSDA
ncbi:MAG TPA: DUF1178 family protein [Stellaceae bacterium]|nr:DUF1178 family protein [Stellaceae bacterium]